MNLIIPDRFVCMVMYYLVSVLIDFIMLRAIV